MMSCKQHTNIGIYAIIHTGKTDSAVTLIGNQMIEDN